jgi:hypothetical protein
MEGKKVHLVKNELELLTTQQILVCFLSVWLGVNQPKTVNQSNLGQALTTCLLEVNTYTLQGAHAQSPSLKCALIQRYWQLRFSDWIQRQVTFHHRLAEFGRKKTRTRLQGAMDEEFIWRGWAIHYVVPPDLAKQVQEVNVRTDTMGKTLELGIHHFIFEPPCSGGVGTYNPSAQYDLLMDAAGHQP